VAGRPGLVCTALCFYVLCAKCPDQIKIESKDTVDDSDTQEATAFGYGPRSRTSRSTITSCATLTCGTAVPPIPRALGWRTNWQTTLTSAFTFTGSVQCSGLRPPTAMGSPNERSFGLTPERREQAIPLESAARASPEHGHEPEGRHRAPIR
jgi:hypothetical protein